MASDLPELYDFSLEKQGKKKALTAFLLWVPILATSSQRFTVPFSEMKSLKMDVVAHTYNFNTQES